MKKEKEEEDGKQPRTDSRVFLVRLGKISMNRKRRENKIMFEREKEREPNYEWHQIVGSNTHTHNETYGTHARKPAANVSLKWSTLSILYRNYYFISVMNDILKFRKWVCSFGMFVYFLRFYVLTISIYV